MSEREHSQIHSISSDDENRELTYEAQYSVNNSSYMILDDGKPKRTEKFV